jgi:hypothetical protein
MSDGMPKKTLGVKSQGKLVTVCVHKVALLPWQDSFLDKTVRPRRSNLSISGEKRPDEWLISSWDVIDHNDGYLAKAGSHYISSKLG